MPISMECPSCLNRFSVLDTMAGQKAKCPECQFTLFVPGDELRRVASTPSQANRLPAGTATPKAEPPQVKAVAPNPTRNTPALTKKPTAARVPALSRDVPSGSAGEETTDPARRRGRGCLAVILIALFALGGLFLLGGGAAWYSWHRAAKAPVAATSAATAEDDTGNGELAKIPSTAPPMTEDLIKRPPKTPDSKPMQGTIEVPSPSTNPSDNPILGTLDAPATRRNRGGKPIVGVSDIPSPANNPAKPNGRINLFLDAPPTVKPGERVTVNVRVVRKDCTGPIRLEIQPKSNDVVPSPLRTLPAENDKLSIELTIDPKAEAGPRSLQVKAKLEDLMDVHEAVLNVEVSRAAAIPRLVGATGKWKGYFGQPRGYGGEHYKMSVELEEKDGKVGGAIRLERRTNPRVYGVVSVKGVRKGDELILTDQKLMKNGGNLGGANWLTHRTFNGIIAPEGVIAGTWRDATERIAGSGTFFVLRMDCNLVIQRKEKKDDGVVVGTLFLNGMELGTVTENADKLIPAGSYPGKVRTVAKTTIVQNPGRQLGKQGDFLLEIANVPGRSDILIHPSNEAKSPDGCVVAGGLVARGRGFLTARDSVASKLRFCFYGTDTPNLVRDLALYTAKANNIKIEVRDIKAK